MNWHTSYSRPFLNSILYTISSFSLYWRFENNLAKWFRGNLHNFGSIFSITLQLFDSKPFLNFILSSLTLISWDLEDEISSPRKPKSRSPLKWNFFVVQIIPYYTGPKFYSTYFDWCQQIVILERSMVFLAFLYGKSHRESKKWNWKS